MAKRPKTEFHSDSATTGQNGTLSLHTSKTSSPMSASSPIRHGRCQHYWGGLHVDEGRVHREYKGANGK